MGVHYSQNHLLRIVPFKIKNCTETFNGVIDDGSTLTFISQNLRQMFSDLKCRIIYCRTSGLNGVEQEINNEEIILPILDQLGRTILVEAIVVDKINSNICLPDMKSLCQRFPELQTVPFPHLPNRPVDILFGQNTPEVLVATQADLFLGKGHPNVRFTTLGPALGYSEKTNPQIKVMLTRVEVEGEPSNTNSEEEFIAQEEMAKLIQKLINNEETVTVPPNKRIQSPLNEELEIWLRNKFRRTPDGHMEVPLPFKGGSFALKNNFTECARFDVAQKTKIVGKNPEYWSHCVAELQKQVNYGAARILSPYENKYEGFYHPIVVVVKESKTSTPIRMCLDASRLFAQENKQKACFNDELPRGTNLLNDISDVLTLFRLHPVTLIADIKKMFFNICVPMEQRKFIRFIFDGTVYESNVYPFGLRISPYVCLLCLKIVAETALNNNEISQETLDAINHQIYMDDGIFSVATPQEAIELAQQIMKTFDHIHMNFGKFISCSREVMRSIPEKRRLSEITFDDPLPESGTLGINYNAEEDSLRLSPVTELAQVITKSEIMRIAAKVYDPNNLLGLITIKARRLTQLIFQIPKPGGKEIPFLEDLEKHRETVPELIEEIIKGYYECGQELMKIDQIKIPRLLIEDKPIKDKTLLIFCDGSTVAYGAVSYLRTSYQDGTVTIRLIKAAKKCTPLRRQTIPRIELMAALEGAKLASRLKKIMKPNSTILFTDAIVVLFWIMKTDLHRFDDYIQVRLTQIHECTKNDSWRHIESGLNPADLLSRGVKLSHIIQNGELTERGIFWFEGPPFLKEEFSIWPRHEREIHQMSKEENEIVKDSIKTFKSLLTLNQIKNRAKDSTVFSVNLNIYQAGENVLDSLKVSNIHWLFDQQAAIENAAKIHSLTDYTKFGTVNKAAKVILGTSTLAHTWLKKIHHQITGERIENMKDAYKKLIREIQADGFSSEIATAKLTKMWPIKSFPSEVNALFDQDGILRSNSRIANCEGIPDWEKRPIILPSTHPFVKTLIHSFHINIGHGGSVSELMSGIRRLIYFPKMRQIVKKYLGACIKCRRKYNKPLQPHMAELPVDIEKMTMFEHVALDFLGPVRVKRARSTEKYYILVLVCIQTHALHLEMCEALETDQVLTALQRFCLEKRVPDKIRSDNGKSFISTKKVLFPETSMEKVDWNQIKRKIDTPEWIFIAPGAPETNLAEAFVKLVKVRLDLDLRSRKFTRDQLSTLLSLAANSVNNRPLTYLSDDIRDPRPVTANMLMKPAFHSNAGLKINENAPMKYRRYFQEILQFAETTSKRWIEEFAKDLKKYPKWKAWTKNVKVGDLVVVIEHNPLKSKNWPMGIVTKTYENPKDQTVRTCHVKYRTSEDSRLGTYLRHVRNLIPLNLWHDIN